MQVGSLPPCDCPCHKGAADARGYLQAAPKSTEEAAAQAPPVVAADGERDGDEGDPDSLF